MRTINQAGLTLIQSFEGFSALPYRDSAGIWTIGYGHTRGVNASSAEISKSDADALLHADIACACMFVEKRILVALTDNQYAALVSLVFNTGTAPLTRTLGRLLNAGNYQAAADEFLKWNHAGGLTSIGLTRRRTAERTLFLS